MNAGTPIKIRAKWRYAVLAAVTIACVFLTVVAFKADRFWGRSIARSDFELTALHSYAAIAAEKESCLHVLDALDAFYASSEVVKRHEFRSFAGTFLSHHPGIKMLEWVPRVPSSDMARYEEAARKKGFPRFQSKEMNEQRGTVGASSLPEHFPVYFVAPQTGNETVLGFDLASDPVLMKSVRRACDSGRMVAVAGRPGQGKEYQDEIFVLDPVYKTGVLVDSVSSRRKYLLGFVAGVFRTGPMIRKSFLDDKPEGIDVFLYEVFADGGDRLIYSSRKDAVQREPMQLPGAVNALWRHASGNIEFTRKLDFAGQKLLVKIIPARGYIAERMTPQPWHVLLIGLLCSGLLCAYLLVTIRRTEDALVNNERLEGEIVERRKSERALLLAAREWRRTFDAISDGISIHDMDMNVKRANRAFCRLLGANEEKLVNVKCYELMHHLPHSVGNCPMERLALTGKPESAEIFEPSLKRWLLVSCFPLFDEESRMTGIVHTVRDISDRKEVEEKLMSALKSAEEAKAKTEAIIAAIGDGISIQDTDYRIIYQNDIEKQMQGDRIGEYCYRAYENEEKACGDCPVAMTFRDGKIHKTERIGSRDGVRSWVEITTSPLRNAEGEIVAGIEVVRDITERKRAEEKIGQLNRLYTVLNEINKLIVRVRDSQNLFGNVCRIAVEYGLFRMAWIASVDRDDGHLVPAAWWGDKEKYVDAVKDIMVGKGKMGTAMGEAVNSGRHYVCNDIGELGGTAPWSREALRRGFLSMAAFPLMTDGYVAGGMAFFSGKRDFFDSEEVALLDELAEDVSFALDTMEKEESRRKAEALMSSILESVEEGFLIIDRQYRVVTANRAYAEMVGMPVEEIVGKDCYRSSHGSDKPCHELGRSCPVKHTLETGETCRVIHTHFDRKGNRLHLEIKSFPIRDASGEVTSAIETVNDISDTKRLEDQLRQAQKMEAVGRLAGGVAHDFNNILSAIMGYGNLLLMKLKTDDPLRENVEQILESADRAANLTRGLLVFSRKQMLSPQPVDLNRIVMQVERLLLRLLGEDIEISTALTAKELTVVADSGQIEQVLMNLATNARDAMPNGGSLSISTAVAELGSDFVGDHGGLTAGTYAWLSVTDSGTGMNKKTKEKIFEPFFTTKEPGKGTGLGLAMVYGTIKQHNGFMDVQSEEGKGTTFSIYLPITPLQQSDAGESDIVHALRGGTEMILMAEDDEALRKLYSMVLTDAGYTVLTAKDGVDAINTFRDHGDEIGLVILDVIMPKKNGGEVLKEIRDIRKDIKALFISGYTGDIIDKAVVADKGADIVHKPISPRDLMAKVRGMLDG